MLLPSALPCDWRRPSTRSRFSGSGLFSTPPPSDDEFPSGNGLLGTCRALQSLLNGSPAPSPRNTKPGRLQSPLNIRSTPPARSRKLPTKQSTPKTRRQPPRGANKRRRCDEEEVEEEEEGEEDFASSLDRFSTPKRQRQAPYHLPLGLSQSDFYSLHSPPVTQSPPSPTTRLQQAERQSENTSAPPFNPDAALPSIEESDETADPDQWTADDDQKLIELVLEKFQLSQHDWDDCARRMGKDHASVGRRWNALVGEGNVRLRRGRRMVRPSIHESWR